MCAPKVMDVVNKQLLRRDLFKASLVGAASAALATSRVKAQEMMLSTNNLVDLSHTVHADIPMWPGTPSPEVSTLVTVADDGFYGNVWTLWEHTGTHMDAPAHFIEGAATADQLDVASFIVPIAVVDIAEKAATDPDAVVKVADLEAWEAEHGELPAGAVVLMHSGWAERITDPESYRNTDADEVMHFPGFSAEAAEFLVSERDITGIGTDTLSLDPGNSATFDAHVTVLGASKYGLENVANLPNIPAAGAHLIVGQPKLQDASGGPVRLLAAFA